MPTILISHAHEEKALAEAWKELLEGVTARAITVWFSSDATATGGMTINTPWIDQVKQKLQSIDHVIAIQTPATEGRRWILYECGYADALGKGIIPVTYRLDPGEIPNPVGAFNAFRGEDPDGVRTACTKLMVACQLNLDEFMFDAALQRYLQKVTLHAPRRALKPDDVGRWVQRIEGLVRIGRAHEVPAKRQEAYYSLNPKAPDPFKPSELTMPLHELLSRVLLEQRCYAEALEEAEYALAIVDDDTEMLHRKALALVELDNKADGLRVVHSLMQDNPYFRDNPELASLEGRIYREQWLLDKDPEDLQRAYDAYQRAYHADKTQYYPGINAASLALARNDMETAETTFREVLDHCQRQPPLQTSFWTHFAIGEALLGLGDVAGALGAYRAGVNHTPAPALRDRESALKGVRRMLNYRHLTDQLPAFEALFEQGGIS